MKHNCAHDNEKRCGCGCCPARNARCAAGTERVRRTRSGDIVVGGTDQEGEWSRTPSPESADAILRRAALLVPELRGARVIRHKVGLRPVRPAVRLERVADVIHCYGHGGAGVTLSWGVAEEVVTLAG